MIEKVKTSIYAQKHTEDGDCSTFYDVVHTTLVDVCVSYNKGILANDFSNVFLIKREDHQLCLCQYFKLVL